MGAGPGKRLCPRDRRAEAGAGGAPGRCGRADQHRPARQPDAGAQIGGLAACARMDKGGAVTAAVHKLARMAYLMLTRGEEYVDQGQLYYEERYRERVVRCLARKAAELDLQFTSAATPA